MCRVKNKGPLFHDRIFSLGFQNLLMNMWVFVTSDKKWTKNDKKLDHSVRGHLTQMIG